MEEAGQEGRPTYRESNTERRFLPAAGHAVSVPSEHFGVQWPSDLVEENTMSLPTSSLPGSSSMGPLNTTADSTSLVQSFEPIDDETTASVVSARSTWGDRRKNVAWTRPPALACLVFAGTLATALLVKASFRRLYPEEADEGQNQSLPHLPSQLELPSKPPLPDDSGSNVNFGHRPYKGIADRSRRPKSGTHGPVWPIYLTGITSQETLTDTETDSEATAPPWTETADWTETSSSNSSAETEKGNSTSAEESSSGSETTAKSIAPSDTSTEAEEPLSTSPAKPVTDSENTAESTASTEVASEVQTSVSTSAEESTTGSESTAESAVPSDVAAEPTGDEGERRNLAEVHQDWSANSTKTTTAPAAVSISGGVANVVSTALSIASAGAMSLFTGANVSSDDQLINSEKGQWNLVANTANVNTTTNPADEYQLKNQSNTDDLHRDASGFSEVSATRAQTATATRRFFEARVPTVVQQGTLSHETAGASKVQTTADISMAPVFNETWQWTNATGNARL
ncbi:hypothetical protein V5799_008214 [Amblyomma americanum]|uniref:Uncharacterized protein n=1 Tax=Amblyomma americanum TaxID=6943 RepID=A0AAQ4FE09_AMBAM